MEGHIGENRDEVEQYVEPDRTGRHHLQIAQVPQHLQARGKDPPSARNGAPWGSCMATRDGAGEPRPASASNATPTDEIGKHARDEAAADAAQARSGNIQTCDPSNLGGRPLVPDLGEQDGKDRRQQQPLNESPGDNCADVG